MTSPEHFLLGVACANIFYSIQSFFKRGPFSYIKLFLVLGLVAILPDIDSFFGSYTSTNPYVGHRGMTHSFAGVAIIGLIMVVIASAITIIIRLFIGYWRFLVQYFKERDMNREVDFSFWRYTLNPVYPGPFFLLFLFTFIAGATHLFADLPQPPSVWKGIPLFFPLKSNGHYLRYGGWSLVGWYDIKILWVLAGTAAVSLPVILVAKFIKTIKLKIVAIPFFIAAILINLWVFYWVTDYIGSSKYEGSRKWAQYQSKVIEDLPEPIRKITRKGKTIFISLFRQMRRAH